VPEKTAWGDLEKGRDYTEAAARFPGDDSAVNKDSRAAEASVGSDIPRRHSRAAEADTGFSVESSSAVTEARRLPVVS
jgi:hypothetical protein